MTIIDQRSLLRQFPWETALTSRTAQQTAEGWESVRGSEVQCHVIFSTSGTILTTFGVQRKPIFASVAAGGKNLLAAQ